MRTNTLPLIIAPLMLLSAIAHAGGPEYVAGASYFDPIVKGLPLTWAHGTITYYTDQGDLSPILLGPAADSSVANAFGSWTTIPTAAVSAIQAGHLAEDVSSANVVSTNGTLSMPVDILPDASSRHRLSNSAAFSTGRKRRVPQLHRAHAEEPTDCLGRRSGHFTAGDAGDPRQISDDSSVGYQWDRHCPALGAGNFWKHRHCRFGHRRQQQR
jgi:hypothetical protein